MMWGVRPGGPATRALSYRSILIFLFIYFMSYFRTRIQVELVRYSIGQNLSSV